MMFQWELILHIGHTSEYTKYIYAMIIVHIRIPKLTCGMLIHWEFLYIRLEITPCLSALITPSDEQ